MTWWQGPMLALDTETTGPVPTTARLVTLTLDHYRDRDELESNLRLLIDPGVPIPEEATKVHGISDARAQAEGMEPGAAVAAAERVLARTWSMEVPLVAFNATFDLTVLDRESRRHLGRPLEIKGPVIDPFVLDKVVDKYVKGANQRRLGPTCERYGITVENWHEATADAWAAQALARALGEKYADRLSTDLRDLWRMQVRAKWEQATELEDYFQKVGKRNADGTPIVTDKAWPIQPVESESH